jgi:AraC-like DNA-binding protein
VVKFERYTDDTFNTSQYVQGVWTLNNNDEPDTIQLLPDGYPEIVIPLKGFVDFKIGNREYIVDNASLIGQINNPASLTAGSNSRMLFIKLYPFVTGLMVDKEAKDFRNVVCEIKNLNANLEDIISSFIQRIFGQTEITNEIRLLVSELNKSYEKMVIPPILIRDQGCKYEAVKCCNIGLQSIRTKMSKRYMEKLYEQYNGLSPIQFLKVLKVKKASILLSNGNPQNIKNISKTLGYHDNSHLYKDFKSLCNFSPKEYIANYHPITFNRSYLNQWDYS